jgi:hypothetical protein
MSGFNDRNALFIVELYIALYQVRGREALLTRIQVVIPPKQDIEQAYDKNSYSH